jgi:hypothetical protein
MIVKENDSSGRKWKYWAVTMLLELLTEVVCLGIPILVFCKIPADAPSVFMFLGVALFFLMFYISGKIIFAIENHIGIRGLLQNPNRENLIQWPPDWYPPWMKMKPLRSAVEASPHNVAAATKKNKALKK